MHLHLIHDVSEITQIQSIYWIEYLIDLTLAWGYNRNLNAIIIIINLL